MFISRKHNFVYLRVPKTGSTSFSHHLVDCFGGDVDCVHTMINYVGQSSKGLPVGLEGLSPHCTIGELVGLGVVDIDFVMSARVLACFRDPIDRFISRCYHLRSQDVYNLGRFGDLNSLVEACLGLVDFSSHFWKSQCSWCLMGSELVNGLFSYSELGDVAFGLTGKRLVYRHRSEYEKFGGVSVLSDGLVRRINELYADDVELLGRLGF